MERINQILAKSSWDESDISYLVSRKGSLTLPVLQKLGLAPYSQNVDVEEPVKEVTETPKEKAVSKTKKVSKK